VHAGRFARRAALRALDCPEFWLEDAPAEFAVGDGAAKKFALPERQLLVDISELAVRDAKTGIQRVVRKILAEWLARPPAGWRIEPVYAGKTEPYRYARSFISGGRKADPPVALSDGDCFIGLDLQPIVVPARHRDFTRMRQCGVDLLFIAYDLLAVEIPQHFWPDAAAIFTRWLEAVSESDAIFCISKATEDSLRNWLKGSGPEIDHFRLGADFVEAEPAVPIWQTPPPAPLILMVGTLESRKGHAEALSAAEALWRQGENFTLVIVGKHGWLVDDLADYIRGHPEHHRRLFWFSSATDADLDALYRQADGLLQASEGEGFGLPLIEAARYGLPLLARDLPVFREVAEGHATFFGRDLVQAWRDWLAALRAGTALRSTGLTWLSWAQSADQLMGKIMDFTARRRSR
jgi:glycosyltransferase involved in cell wall biosynthesis